MDFLLTESRDVKVQVTPRRASSTLTERNINTDSKHRPKSPHMLLLRIASLDIHDQTISLMSKMLFKKIVWGREDKCLSLTPHVFILFH